MAVLRKKYTALYPQKLATYSNYSTSASADFFGAKFLVASDCAEKIHVEVKVYRTDVSCFARVFAIKGCDP